MHIPSSFKVSDQDELFSFINQHSFGQLISIVDDRPCSTHLPFLIDSENQKLICHLGKANLQWKNIQDQEVLVTFLGPHDYISPTWYVGNGVPTWDYQAVHVYGRAIVIDDHDMLKKYGG
jgi:transcriptional regulator